VVKRLRELVQEMEGLGARSIMNYVLYEFEVGGPSLETLEEAEQMAKREMEELKEVLKILGELKSLVT
jgi:small-conductance mechanosensitive channel